MVQCTYTLKQIQRDMFYALCLCTNEGNMQISEIGHIDLPSIGIDEAVGGAASTNISNKTRKLENMLIAEIK